MEDKPKEPLCKILGLLDAKTRLACDRHAFIIQFLKRGKNRETGEHEDMWIGQYYYSDLGSAIRGYVKHYARRKGKKLVNEKPLLDIIALIGRLEERITKVGENLSAEWHALQEDPVEKLIEQTLAKK